MARFAPVVEEETSCCCCTLEVAKEPTCCTAVVAKVELVHCAAAVAPWSRPHFMQYRPVSFSPQSTQNTDAIVFTRPAASLSLSPESPPGSKAIGEESLGHQ